MNGDLISRAKAIAMHNAECSGECDCCKYITKELECGILLNVPAVDAEPVRRSRWHYHGDGYYFCGECKKYIVCIGGDADLNYCPNCGAMNKEE